MIRGAALFLGFLIILSAMAFAEPTSGPLTVSPDNPRYFQDSQGNIVYLAGSHIWYNIHYNDNNPQMTDEEFDEFLDWMQEHNYTYTRLWTGWANNYPKPWNQVGGKFDMTSYNQAYFDMLHGRIEKLQERGIYCSVMFFGSLIAMSTSGWSNMAWNPNNNINPELADAFSTTDGNTFYTTDPGALAIQHQFVNKMIDSLNDLDNIIWEIGNEAEFTESRFWQYDMVDYVKSYEAGKPLQHLVGITSDGWSGQLYLDWVLDSPADWVSPTSLSTWGQPATSTDDYKEGGPASYSGKVIINDVDHLWGNFELWDNFDEGRRWIWKTFVRGNNPILMDCYDSNVPTFECYGSIDPVTDPIRNALGSTVEYSIKLDLARTFPSERSSDCSTRYCLVNSGEQYLIYQPGSGSFTADVEYGDYDYEWFNPRTNSIIESGTMTVSSHTFNPPFSGDAVLYLDRASPAQTYSCTGQVPSDAVAYDSEESIDLTTDKPWVFSATDTTTKCQYHCNAGFTWDGSSCTVQSQADPISYWNLDEGSGTLAHDSSGNGNDGILKNGPAWTTGKTGTHALSFDGVDDYVDAGNDPSLDFIASGSMSIAAWVNLDTLPSALGHYEGTVQKTVNGKGFIFEVCTDDRICVENGNGWSEAHGSTALAAGKWYHVVFVYDDQTTRFYLDGIDDTDDTGAGTFIDDTTSHVFIGGLLSPHHEFEGRIDDVRIYNRALSSSEISDLFYQGAGPACSSDADSDPADGVVSTDELIQYISGWKSGDVGIHELMIAIAEWKVGC